MGENGLEFDSIELMETIQVSFDYLKREYPMGEARKGALRLELLKSKSIVIHRLCRWSMIEIPVLWYLMRAGVFQ